MNLLENGNVMYMSSVDISAGTGPGVNELEFITELSNILGERAYFLIPKPKYTISDMPKNNCYFSTQMTREEKSHYIFHTFTQIKNGKKIINNKNIDLVVFRLGSLPYSQYVIARKLIKKGIPFVVKTAGPKLLEAFSGKNDVIHKVLDRLHRMWTNYILTNCQMCDCVSEIHRSGLQEVYPSLKIQVVDNAVNTRRFAPKDKDTVKEILSLQDSKYVVGYAGNFPYSRGAKQIVQILQQLINKYKSITFVALGAGTGYEELVELAKTMGVFKYCRFPGVVPFETVPDWINTFSVGVSFLEEKSAGASEQKIRQYLSCGVPVVCSEGSSSFVEKAGIGKTSAFDDLERIADNISYYLDMKDEYGKISKKCREYAEKNLSIKASTEKRLSLWGEFIE